MEQTKTHGFHDSGLSAVNIELATSITQMKIDGAFAQAKDSGGLPAGLAKRHPFQALQLSPG